MSPDETKRLLAVASSLKARILLGLGYGCELRAGEVVRLKGVRFPCGPHRGRSPASVTRCMMRRKPW